MTITTKTWTGAFGEYFTHGDMTRVESNANELAGMVGRPTVSFLTVTRASQFRYDEAQKLEGLLTDVADELGIQIQTEQNWAAGRMVSATDFNRWEQNTSLLQGEIGKTVRQLTWQAVSGRIRTECSVPCGECDILGS